MPYRSIMAHYEPCCYKHVWPQWRRDGAPTSGVAEGNAVSPNLGLNVLRNNIRGGHTFQKHGNVLEFCSCQSKSVKCRGKNLSGKIDQKLVKNCVSILFGITRLVICANYFMPFIAELCLALNIYDETCMMCWR